jgi:hypothetical protein
MPSKVMAKADWPMTGSSAILSKMVSTPTAKAPR